MNCDIHESCNHEPRKTQVSFQDQDTVGGRFDAKQAFSGILQSLYVLRGELTGADVMSIYKMNRRADFSFLKFYGNNFIIQNGNLSCNRHGQ